MLTPMAIRGRLLGIDYGSKRVGVALSDEGGRLAFPECVLVNDSQLVDELLTLIEAKNVQAIVVGHSKNRDGSDNNIHQATARLIDKLSKVCDRPIHLEPEQYTTQAALRIQGWTDQTDAAAASLILDGYIRRQENNKLN